MSQVNEFLDAVEAARRLGVKPDTLYAYVSRGVLARHRSPEGRSLFDPAEVERLARRGRPRRGPGAGEVVIESAVTMLGADRPYYRGRDALRLAAATPFEAVAEWLWSGDPVTLSAPPAPAAWVSDQAAVAAGRAAQSGLPPDVLALERIQVIVPAIAATDPSRSNLDPVAVVDAGRGLIAGIVDCLPPACAAAPASGQAAPPGRGASPKAGLADRERAGGIAGRLWSRLTAEAPEPVLVDALRMALVLLADHELAASTLAVRVAASVRADPYAAVLTGLGVMSGPLHGGASLGAEGLLAEAEAGSVRDAVGLRLRRGERIPGFGHAVYRPTDARALALLARLRAIAPEHPALGAADALLAEARRRRVPEPNIDFALATLARVAGMPAGSAEAVFAVARTAGWLAHAVEEYGRRTNLRLRAVYNGPMPEV